jgi:hypothetical protein
MSTVVIIYIIIEKCIYNLLHVRYTNHRAQMFITWHRKWNLKLKENMPISANNNNVPTKSAAYVAN